MYYFFSATLPELRPGEIPPLTLAEFDELAAEYLTPRHYAWLAADDPRARVCREMARFEEFLRIRIAERRAEKLKQSVEFPEPESFYCGIDEELSAVAALNPAERERAVDMMRWRLLDELTCINDFDFDHICAYRAKLRLAEKYRGRDAKAGRDFFDSAVREMAEQ